MIVQRLREREVESKHHRQRRRGRSIPGDAQGAERRRDRIPPRAHSRAGARAGELDQIEARRRRAEEALQDDQERRGIRPGRRRVFRRHRRPAGRQSRLAPGRAPADGVRRDGARHEGRRRFPPCCAAPAGFHIVKLLEKRSHDEATVVDQTHARHILVRVNETDFRSRRQGEDRPPEGSARRPAPSSRSWPSSIRRMPRRPRAATWAG